MAMRERERLQTEGSSTEAVLWKNGIRNMRRNFASLVEILLKKSVGNIIRVLGC
jgi:hypothetical protein